MSIFDCIAQKNHIPPSIEVRDMIKISIPKA